LLFHECFKKFARGDDMKGFVSAALAVALAVVLATGAFAQGAAGGPGHGKGYGKCQAANMTPEQNQKFTQFQNEVLPLKQKMLQLRTELRTLRAQTPTNWDAVSAKQKEMVDVRIEIQKKAAAYGFPGCGMGHGLKGHHGPRGGGY
jgi:Spy/CpxP family protein refolding chaperone